MVSEKIIENIIIKKINEVSKYLSSINMTNYITLTTRDDYTWLTLHKPPVNAMTLELLQELLSTLKGVQQNPPSRGLIIDSSTNVFSAGVDLNELVHPNPTRFRELWNCFQDVLICLYSSPLVTVAMMGGAAVGGGCALALCCDYRIAVEGDYKIGVNAVRLGMPVPRIVCRLTEVVLGHRTAEKYLLPGRLVNPVDALQCGFVDEIVSADKFRMHVVAVMNNWLEVPDFGRTVTQNILRQKLIAEFEEFKEKDTEMFANCVGSEMFQKSIGEYLNELKSNRTGSKL